MNFSPWNCARSRLRRARLGDEHARAIDAGRMELHELHVLEEGRREAPWRCRRRCRYGPSAGEIGAAIAAGRENDLVGAEAMQRAVLHRQRDDAAAAALVVMMRSMAKYSMKNSAEWRSAWPYMVCSMAWPVRSARRKCAWPGRNRWSCRRRRAGSCRPRCARRARPNVRARKPLAARCGRDIRWHPGRRANPIPSPCRTCASASRRGPYCRAPRQCRLAPPRCGAGGEHLGDASGAEPASLQPTTARKPEPPAPTTTTS